MVAEGRTREFSTFEWQGAVPNPQDPATFARSKLNWSELSEPRHAELLQWYRQLIRLRRDQVRMPAESRIDSPHPEVKFDAAADWLTFVHNGVLAIFNLGDGPRRISMPHGEWKLMLRSDAKRERQIDAVPARTTLIYIGG